MGYLSGLFGELSLLSLLELNNCIVFSQAIDNQYSIACMSTGPVKGLANLKNEWFIIVIFVNKSHERTNTNS